VLVLETGIGPKRTETVLHWLLSQPMMGGVPYRPKVILSAGFSGALQPGLLVGDIILATEVKSKEGPCWPTTWPAEWPQGDWRPPLHPGRLLSGSELIARPEDKQTLGQEHQAVAVDMETATVARICRQRGIPFSCVRAVLDDLETPLSPRLVQLLSVGRVSAWRAAMALLRAPGLGIEFARLAQRSRFAGEQLGKALGELLTLTLPWSAQL
jgi:adenosylhomocysteine nucleosidase